ncbi:hypothetical protein AVEN_49936-1 [Araneus ventricosus]|uniref:Uncharacterized protein n=1 Tax=Araneus ventricosus TaxID=182803 RepID=A0A4Y2IM44_ARAVE|nr:hypothetical protein AVEN_173741-1 [Araneus ventricosus]GBM78711.1 hypothetical protein AVEN_49936-1 [Araneus ventricosus]
MSCYRLVLHNLGMTDEIIERECNLKIDDEMPFSRRYRVCSQYMDAVSLCKDGNRLNMKLHSCSIFIRWLSMVKYGSCARKLEASYQLHLQ